MDLAVPELSYDIWDIIIHRICCHADFNLQDIYRVRATNKTLKSIVEYYGTCHSMLYMDPYCRPIVRLFKKNYYYMKTTINAIYRSNIQLKIRLMACNQLTQIRKKLMCSNQSPCSNAAYTKPQCIICSQEITKNTQNDQWTPFKHNYTYSNIRCALCNSTKCDTRSKALSYLKSKQIFSMKADIFYELKANPDFIKSINYIKTYFMLVCKRRITDDDVMDIVLAKRSHVSKHEDMMKYFRFYKNEKFAEIRDRRLRYRMNDYRSNEWSNEW